MLEDAAEAELLADVAAADATQASAVAPASDSEAVESADVTSAAALTAFAGAFEATCAAALPPVPKVKDWLGSALLQVAISMTAPLTVKQLPAWLLGDITSGPAPPANGNVCELVTPPPRKDQSRISTMKRKCTYLHQLGHRTRT